MSPEQLFLNILHNLKIWGFDQETAQGFIKVMKKFKYTNLEKDYTMHFQPGTLDRVKRIVNSAKYN